MKTAAAAQEEDEVRENVQAKEILLNLKSEEAASFRIANE
jgi:hypothetical protein